jgi:tRNA 2-selenouridine synthase
MEDFVRLVLVYYDKTYRAGLAKRDQAKVHNLDTTSNLAIVNAQLILNFTKEIEGLPQA